MAVGHYPVMLEEAVGALSLSEGDTVVDATYGGGGHARRILEELGAEARLIAIDRDPSSAERASLLEDPRFEFVNGTYDDVLWRMVKDGARADAVLFDLGLSSYQIDEPERGFSYTGEGFLDMRMDPTSGISAADYLNTAETEELIRTLNFYGDVPKGQARRVAEEILARRPLSTTNDLTESVRAAVGWAERGGHPAKRIFQAIRIKINDELTSLRRALEATESLLVHGGRLVAISFHSGEDRIVKRFISDRVGKCTCPPELPVCVCGAKSVFRKGTVTQPSTREIKENPRSASARLRSATRTDEPSVGEAGP